METSDNAAPKTGMAAFQEKLAEIRGGSEPQTFADKLEEAGVDVEVRDKEPEPVVEPEPAEAPQEAAEAPEPTADPEEAQEATDALLDALEGKQPGEKRNAKIERRKALEERLLELGEDPYMANLIAHRGKLSKAEEHLARVEAKADNTPAGLDEQASQGIPASSATPDGQLAPEGLDQLLKEGGLDEVPARAIVDELSRLRAELAEVRGTAQVSIDATRAQHRAAAKSTLDSAVGELSGRFPGLVRDGVLDPSVGQTAAALLNTPLVGGDLSKALEMAARERFPEVEAKSRQTTKPTRTRDTEAPSASPQQSSQPLSDRDKFKRQAALLGKHRNDPDKAVAELNKLNRRLG